MGPGSHGSTFGGNPVCCAGALAVLDTMDEAFLAQVRERAAQLRAGLAALPHVQQVSGLGLMVGIELADGIKAAEVRAACEREGLLVLTAKTRLRLLPPLILTADDVAAALATPAPGAGKHPQLKPPPLTDMVYWLYYCQGGENGERNAATKNKAGAGAVHAGRIAVIMLGTAILSFGIHNIHQRTAITEGGIIGLVLLINHWLGVPASIASPLLDAASYALAFKFLGWDFLLGGYCQRQSGRVLPPLGVSAPRCCPT